MDDGELLLRAIRENPGDDTPRLAYADWLDEQPAGEMTCRQCCGTQSVSLPTHGNPLFKTMVCRCQGCGCSKCGATGLDASDRDRAAFIRKQCELVARELTQCRRQVSPGPGAAGNPHRVNCGRCEWCILKWQTKSLEDLHPEWKTHECRKCNGHGHPYAAGINIETARDARRYGCPVCGSTGDLLTRFDPEVDRLANISRNPQFARGLVDSVQCTLSELGEEREIPHDPRQDLNERMEYRPKPRKREFAPSPWVVAVVRALPVTRFVLTDRDPHNLGSRWRWWMTSGPDSRYSNSAIPEHLYMLVRDVPGVALPASYDTRELAIDALALACGKLVRSAVYGKQEVAS